MQIKIPGKNAPVQARLVQPAPVQPAATVPTSSLKIPGKGKATATAITPGQRFAIKRAEQINGVPTTAEKDLQTVLAVAAARGEPIDTRPQGNRIVRFKRAGIDIEITPDPSQLRAVDGVIRQQLACITGAAGTGKTTVERIIVQELEQGISQTDISRYGKDSANPDTADRPARKVVSIAFAAYTGKAMQQMKKNLSSEYVGNCYTIHMLLGFYPEWYDDEFIDPATGNVSYKAKMKFVPWYTAENKLPWRVIIIDEASMVPIDLWNLLIDACHPDTRIILIGDINQLPPIMGRSMFGYALLQWPSHELTQIHRQKGENNPIVDNAWKILQGMIPEKVPGHFDMLEIERDTADAVIRFLKVVIKLQRAGEFVPIKEDGTAGDMIIVPQNVSEIGQERINELLIPYFNPRSQNALDRKGERVPIVAGFEHKTFAVGDKVMATVNDYDTGVTNGMLGVILDIVGNEKYAGKNAVHTGPTSVHVDDDELDRIMGGGKKEFNLTEEILNVKDNNDGSLRTRAASHIVTVDFGLNQLGNRIIVDFASAGQVNSLKLASAATCHKCQGSEFETVVILCHSANSTMLYREWLYTAVTRASKRVVLLYDRRGLTTALGKQKIKGRNLAEKAQAFIDWQKESEKEYGNKGAFEANKLPVLWAPKGM